MSSPGPKFTIPKLHLKCNKFFRDTAGQERFAPAGQLYYHGANAVMIAYDITNKASFENINKWKEKFEEKKEEESGVIKLLVGCKADLENKREVDKKQSYRQELNQ